MNSIALPPIGPRLLTAPEFQRLAEVPPEAQWFANLDSAQTRRAYKNDLQAFMAFTGIVKPEEFRTVTRSHILAWRAELGSICFHCNLSRFGFQHWRRVHRGDR